MGQAGHWAGGGGKKLIKLLIEMGAHGRPEHTYVNTIKMDIRGIDC
jgi:hypothetical protein